MNMYTFLPLSILLALLLSNPGDNRYYMPNLGTHIFEKIDEFSGDLDIQLISRLNFYRYLCPLLEVGER